MKKMLIVVATVAMAFAACGKKKDAAKPTGDGSATMPAGAGSDMGSGSDMTPAPTDGTGTEAAPATP
jgi:hypothetical protein